MTADLTASACDDSTRLVFVRSDLLLWTHSIVDYHAVQRCDGFTILHPFVIRASRDADIVLLGVGHHFPRALMLAEKWSHWDGGLQKGGGRREKVRSKRSGGERGSVAARRAVYNKRSDRDERERAGQKEYSDQWRHEWLNAIGLRALSTFENPSTCNRLHTTAHRRWYERTASTRAPTRTSLSA